jgi:RNA polymerase sigma factor (sigma-70 family)
MPRPRPRATEIEFYEGLIRKTASMYAPYVDQEFEDIVSIFRVEVWRALAAYDPARSSMPVERYAFSCVKNRAKDLLCSRRRREVFFDDVPAELEAASHDDAFGPVEDELPLLPSTLTERERQVLALLYLDFSQRESTETAWPDPRQDREHGALDPREMSDWRPSSQDTRVAA